ncbi:polymer-forming cytoskeletal protein [Thermobrachium celere]|uniref:polymer-forming cytoskeletal protein n=1 Tax=Thermobrachium celere TaxID=53422 RepID=UPI0019405919|nr:polymer-forming cytoskeletal protein [Thermobrachium celere]GFR36636.1 hypothetical protein TCEA9_24480 [Thermobrachium celere]
MIKRKNGSAMIYVILMLAVLFIVSVGVMQITLASLKQSNNFYQKNQAYYYVDSSTDKILYFIDIIGDEARNYANNYCYTPSGAPNLDNEEVKNVYENYLSNKDRTQYENAIRNIFKREYSKYIDEFFKGQKELSREIKVGDNVVNISGYWTNWKNEIIRQINNNKAEVNFSLFRELNENSEEYKKIFKEDIEKDKLSNYNSNQYPIETLIVNVRLKDNGTQRYMITTFEFNPFKGKDFSNQNKKIQRGFNRILDYALISGRNIIVANGQNTLTVKGDIYAKGTGNYSDENKPYDFYGGVLVGIDSNALDSIKNGASVNRSNLEFVSSKSGQLKVHGNIFTGSIDENKNVISGFVRTVTANSKLEVEGDVYCHSIVIDEKASGSNINIKNAYIADNISLYSKNSNLHVQNELISYETADSQTNYNSSSSIIINDTSSKLKIGGRVVLFGVAFVDELIKENSPFRTLETTAINPNFIIYNYSSEKEKYKGSFSEYLLKNNNSFSINLFESLKALPPKAMGFILDYLYFSKVNNSEYDYNYDMGDSIDFSGDFSNSYFPYFFSANGKLYKYGNSNIDSINSLENIKANVSELKEINGLDVATARYIADEKKKFVVKKLTFKDKGLDSNSFLDYLNEVPEIEIKDDDNKIFIKISKNDITINNLEAYNEYKILLFSSGNIILDSREQTKVYGNVLANGDLVIKGENITIETNKQYSKQLMNYFNKDKKSECKELYKFFAKGITAEEYYEQEIYAGLEEKAKTNILIKSKRQLVIK